MRRIPLLLLCLALGCDTHDTEPQTIPGVSFTASLTVPPGGPRLALTLANRSPGRIGYRTCPTTIERRKGSEWVASEWSPLTQCSDEYQTLEAGSEIGESVKLDGLAAGTYRARATVWRPFGAAQQITSNSFAIAP